MHVEPAVIQIAVGRQRRVGRANLRRGRVAGVRHCAADVINEKSVVSNTETSPDRLIPNMSSVDFMIRPIGSRKVSRAREDIRITGVRTSPGHQIHASTVAF